MSAPGISTEAGALRLAKGMGDATMRPYWIS